MRFFALLLLLLVTSCQEGESSFLLGAGGKAWGAPDTFPGTEGSQLPKIGADGDGNAIAVWLQLDTVRWNLHARRYVMGTGWLATELLETSPRNVADFHFAIYDGQRSCAAFDQASNAVVVWYQLDPMSGESSIWSRHYTGELMGARSALESESGSAQYPSVAVDGAGNAFAVWQQDNGSAQEIRANLFR